MSVKTPLVGWLWRVLEICDIDPGVVIPADAYRPGAHFTTGSRISLDQYNGFLARAIELVDDPAIGIRAASLIHPSHLGAFGFAWLACSSLLSGFEIMQRFCRVFHDAVRVSVIEEADCYRVTHEMTREPPYPEIGADGQIGGLVQLCRLNYGESFKPLTVSLRRKRPANEQIWHDHFGVTVNFSEPENGITVDKEVAETVLTGAHSRLFEMHREGLTQILGDLDASNIGGRTRNAIIRQLPTANVTESTVAKMVDMNARTLHRRLSEEGLTFRTVLREVRTTLAQRYVGDDQYTITEIAFMLGYSDSSGFSRAFKHWFGVTPSSWRMSANN